MSLHELMRRWCRAAGSSRSPPAPGYVTVGGAIAADVHGKNHHVDASFGAHVRSLTLLTADGDVRSAAPRATRLFWATVGRHGPDRRDRSRRRSGCIPVETSRMVVDTERAADLDDADGGDGRDRRPLPLLRRLDRPARPRRGGWAAACSPAATTPARASCPRRDRARPARLRTRRLAAARRWVPERPAQPAHRPAPSTRSGTARRPRARTRRDPGHRALLPSARRRARAGTGSTARAASCSTSSWCRSARRRRCAGSSSRLLERAACRRSCAVLKRFGPGNPGLLSFPMPGLDAGPGHPGRAAAGSPGCSTELDELGGRRRRPGLPGQGLPAAGRAAGRDVPAAGRVARGPRRVDPAGCSTPTSPGGSGSDAPRRRERHEERPGRRRTSVLLLGGAARSAWPSSGGWSRAAGPARSCSPRAVRPGRARRASELRGRGARRCDVVDFDAARPETHAALSTTAVRRLATSTW